MRAIRGARRSSVIFEVFRQEKKGAAFAHAGSVSAPDATFAEAFAREQYGRRQESVALWVVPRDAVHTVTDFADELNKSYHRVDGYSLKVKLKEARKRAAESAVSAKSADALSAGGG
jgi:phenylacetate-CoA oxygenase PaaH subunit